MNANTDYQDVFSKGTLVRLETSCWTGRAKIPSRVLLDGSNHADVDPKAVGAHKRLVDGKALRDVEKIRGEAQQWLYSRSLPFPLKGAVFVPTSEVSKVHEALQGFAERYAEAADDFAADFGSLREAAKASLGSLYDEADYPPNVRAKFGFSWQFFTLSAPGENQILDPAIVADANAKFSALMAEAGQQAVAALRSRFAESVDRMVERLSGESDDPKRKGKPKVFRDSLVGNLREFFDSFKSLNVSNDADLEALVSKAQAALAGVDVKDLRSNESLRAHVAKQMGAVQESLDGMMVDRPTRKLRFGKATDTPDENGGEKAA